MVRRIGTADSATPHPDPSGGQAPRLAKSSTALHFLIAPSATGLQFGRIRRWSAGIEVDWRAHPGSESGTCFRTNRSCRQGPAHQGMKSWSRGLVRRIGTGDSATPLLRPSGGQAPRLAKSSTALHFLPALRGVNSRLVTARMGGDALDADGTIYPGSESGTSSHLTTDL